MFLTTHLTTIATITGVPHNGVSAGCGSFHPNANSNEPGLLFTIKASANKCFEFVSFTKHNWWSAESHCKANGGHLVHISNIQVKDGINSFVHSHGGQNVWIGFNDINIEEKFAWVSGDPVTITNWKEGRFAIMVTAQRTVIDNIRQQSGVFQVVRGSGLQNVWIGLHDHDIEEHYSRTSGSVAGFTNFITSHTNLHNSQDCVSLEAQTGLWHDELFTEANPYLCEIGLYL
ncbi:hypothetical protein DPMN_125839 [Dreissena polymorpha]|uniref:C-type lectin domain-containing protein n=1 Tax=Dreissena polymorpha TaxID=45954 RepID=A0A9D4GUM7_DREPO|nr:hypothetical protein DPMN_125839 [Dreissena polymorpha]